MKCSFRGWNSFFASAAGFRNRRGFLLISVILESWSVDHPSEMRIADGAFSNGSFRYAYKFATHGVYLVKRASERRVWARRIDATESIADESSDFFKTLVL